MQHQREADLDGWDAWVRQGAADDREGYVLPGAVDLLGSWCSDPDSGDPTFVMFIPELFWRPGILVRSVDQMVSRFAWLTALVRKQDAEDAIDWSKAI